METTEEPMVEYIPQSGGRPFCVRLDGEEHFLSEQQFKYFFQDCEDAAQAYEAEKWANRQYLKSRYEAARKRR